MSNDHTLPIDTINEKRLQIVLALTGTFLLAEVAGGIWSQSLALLSDAAHMLTDVMALIIALVAIKVGRRAADNRRTFGYKRFEILAAALNAIVLFLVAFYILYEAYGRFQQPPEIQSGWMLLIASVGLVVNIIGMIILSKSDPNNLNMRGASLEVLSDLIGSVGVIVAALIVRYTGWWQVDPILAVLIGLWVLPRTWKLFSESVNVLLEGVPQGIELQKLHDELKAIPNVKAVHDLHVWAVTTGQNSMSAHLTIDRYPSDDALRQQAQQIAKKYGVEHSNFQIEIIADEPSQNYH